MGRKRGTPMLPFSKSPAPVNIGCMGLTLVASPTSPQPPGTSIVFTATVGSCSPTLYQFEVHRPDGSLLEARDWSSAASFTWVTNPGLPLGSYTIRVAVRHADDPNEELVFTLFYALG